MELKITSDKVLAAAEKCPTAKETLKTLFPEVFEEDKYFNFDPIADIAAERGFTHLDSWKLERKHGLAICVIQGGKYRYRGFELFGDAEWELKRDFGGNYLLIPSKK